MRISDWSSDVCSSDLFVGTIHLRFSRIRQCVGGGIHAPRPSSTGNRRNAGHRDLRSPARAPRLAACKGINRETDRKSVVEGKSVSVRVDLGGRRIIKKKKKNKNK